MSLQELLLVPACQFIPLASIKQRYVHPVYRANRVRLSGMTRVPDYTNVRLSMSNWKAAATYK